LRRRFVVELRLVVENRFR